MSFSRFVVLALFLISNFVFSECSDLDQSDCEYWSGYCSWNSEQNICEEIGGGGGGTNTVSYTHLTLPTNREV